MSYHSFPSTQFAAEFDSSICDRGAEYFRAGRAHIDTLSENLIVARVRGSRAYHVRLEREDRSIAAECTCPYYDTSFCKHIWAVMLATDHQPLFRGSGLRLVHRDDEPVDTADEAREKDRSEWTAAAETRAYSEELQRRLLSNGGSSAFKPVPVPQPKADPNHWRSRMAQLESKPTSSASHPSQPWPATRGFLYVIDEESARQSGVLGVEVLCRDRKTDGEWGAPKAVYLQREWQHQCPDPDDRQILTALAGAAPFLAHSTQDFGSVTTYSAMLPHRYGLYDSQPRTLLPILCHTGRCVLRVTRLTSNPGVDPTQLVPLTWQDEPWEFRLEVLRCLAKDGSEGYELVGALHRGEARLDPTDPELIFESGVLVMDNWAAAYEHHGAFAWIRFLRQYASLHVPISQGEEFLLELLSRRGTVPLDLPEELRYEEVKVTPRPRLKVRAQAFAGEAQRLQGELSFEYDGLIVLPRQKGGVVPKLSERRVLVRDAERERQAEQRLQALGWRWLYLNSPDVASTLEAAARHLPNTVRELISEGWHVEAQGKVYRGAGRFNVRVASGVDWFEVHGAMEFNGATAHLPELLAAVRRGEDTVKLDDGAWGVLPQEWLKQYGLLAGLAESNGDHVRLKRSQVGLLDALLAAQPQVQCDAVFAQVREELRSFCGVHPLEPPAGFAGDLRPYQKEALGWFDFLRRFGFGGCLADDMGLGKTVQVLALLASRRAVREQAGPSLAVVPKSLIFNWQQEAARFAPHLRVLDHTGATRLKGYGHFEDYDLVLTTYGTLRIDAADFQDVEFDYLILDESQAIKNGDSLTAKAVRLLKGQHRLALSGTPIENHLGELWSLFEFLNPGMLGAASVFKMARGVARNPDEHTRKLLAQALRPFLLRRTKAQVARDLPDKVEQTLYCELDTRQRRLYDQLRTHYRNALLKRVDEEGIGRSKIQILEALLRLRQAAIHPGLLDEGRLAESSAKLDVLLPRVLETIEEGHKTLVFSQFTGMLAILRKRLDAEGVAYAYLDGGTRDRQACVERFQSDPDCKLFLISLKAGGTGLNLTAAQYVFLLDPWWNPAVESQAIDRTHRIGQTRQVFAYRLIARDTVEEKVLELQNSKRDLADAIVGANEGLIRTLKREDLELLLS